MGRGVRTRYTFAGSVDRSPIWSPDGKQIAFSRNQANNSNLFLIPSDSAGGEKALYVSPSLKRPTSWSPDGNYVLFTETLVGFGVSLISTTGDPNPREFLPKQITTSDGAFSPDGRWVVYTSQESGRPEIYVTQFPGPKGKWQISNNGGFQPIWRRDGKAIFYWAADQAITEAQLDTKGAQLEVSAVHPLFKVSMPQAPFSSPSYDVAPDGQRFIVNTTLSGEEQPLTIITNWTSLLRRK